jgi:uncharacterized protein (TIGR02246 family)
MAGEKIEGIMRDCLKALAAKDIDKVLSYYTEDGDWTTSEGVFKGKTELRRYLKWMADTVKDPTINICGNGIVVDGNRAFVEHKIGGTINGKKVEYLAMCAWEFVGDKVQHSRTTGDRLLLAKQAVNGWLPKMIVNSIISQSEKGLH